VIDGLRAAVPRGYLHDVAVFELAHCDLELKS
jgi:hypothetical protein